MKRSLSIATANTFSGRLLMHPNGLDPFATAGVDIILLQEVLGLDGGVVATSLRASGYSNANAQLDAGLVIAVRDDSEFEIIAGTQRYEPTVSRGHRFTRRLRPRGLLSVELETKTGNRITVATTHVSVFTRHRARGLQLKALAVVLKHDRYMKQPIILGADMNHYPRAGKKDLGLHASADLTLAAIVEPTWAIRGTKHEWLGRLGSVAMRRPLDSFDAHLDAMLYRGEGLELLDTSVIPVESDHRAIKARFHLV